MHSRITLFFITVHLLLSLTIAVPFNKNDSAGATIRQISAPDLSLIQVVVNGIDALSVTIPHIAQLFIGMKSRSRLGRCTATVIRDRWLMTAAHCFNRRLEMDFGRTFAFIGERRTNTRAEPLIATRFFFDRVLIHNGFKRKDGRNDIALIRLSQRIPQAQYSPVSIAWGMENDPKPGETVRTSGFGYIDNARTLPGVLQETVLEIESFEVCKEATDPAARPFLEERKQICAISPRNATLITDTCNGDSGGPLFRVIPGRSQIRQFGITSFGSTANCAQPDTVAYYTRVSAMEEDIFSGLKDNFHAWDVFNA